ncbi:hypothetical protein ScPMuIL_005669 [Solemya velum]
MCSYQRIINNIVDSEDLVYIVYLDICLFHYNILLHVTSQLGHTHPDPVIVNTNREREVYLHILNSSTYIPALTPSASTNDVVNVSLFFMFTRVEDLAQKDHILTASYYLSQSWNDPRLAWNPEDYNNVTRLIVPVSMLWTPDLTLYNTGSPSTQPVSANDQMAHVLMDGTVFWVPQITSKSYCPLDLTYFPSDTQKCKLLFGSWVYESKEVHFVKSGSGISLEEHSFSDFEHPNWQINKEDLKADIAPIKFDCCPEHYDIVTIELTMTRNARHFKAVVFGPPTLLAMLVPVLFLLPTDAPEKTTLGAMMLVALTLEMVVQVYYIPPSFLDVPNLVMFTTGTYVLGTLGIISAAIVSSLAKKSSSPRIAPVWVHSIFLGRCGLRRLLFMNEYAPVNTQPNFTNALRQADCQPHDMENNLLEREMSTVQTPELREIAEYLRTLIEQISSKDAISRVNKDWMEIARVLDRFFFFLYSILFIIMCLALLAY